MRSDAEKEFLIKAIDAFKNRFLVVSPDFNVLSASHNFKKMHNSKIAGQKCHKVFYDRSIPCVNCAVKEVMEKGHPVLKAKPEDLLDQGKTPCFYAYPIYSGNEIEAFVSMDFDLPPHGEIAEKLHQSNAFLRNLIFSAVDGVIAADKKGNILIFNETAAEVFGYTVDEALGKLNIRDIYPENTAYEVMQKLRSDEFDGNGKLRQYQVNIIHKNGEAIPIRLNAAIVYEGEREVATIGFFHDLREELRLKRELENTQIQLLQSEKMASLGKLAAGVAHQLNNPLGGITLFAKLIMEEYDLEKNHYFKQPCDINKALSRTLFLLEDQILFQNIKINRDLALSLPPVQADVQQLNHLFMNIVLNAAEAMEGKGELSVRSYLLPGGDRVCLEISDTGPGIPGEILPHIFEPFFTTKEQGKGTGLGLSLVYSIVDNHEGNIKARSNPGEGATFIIELPFEAKGNGGDEIGE
jgi:PAS domain S-box-containing protein